MASLKTPPKADKLTRAALRYFGGKWQIAPWVISHLPAHRVYVEPFGGAASVLMRKPRSTIEVYNDLDEEIVGIFQQLQDPAQCSQLMRLLRRTPYARGAFEQAFEPTCDPLARAQRAIVRAYMSFHHGALFDPKKRTFADARHRGGNHCKAHEWASYPRHLVRICQRLQGVIIERRDALEVIRAQDSPDTLFFVDPPYLPSTPLRHRLPLRADRGTARRAAHPSAGHPGPGGGGRLPQRAVRRHAQRLAAHRAPAPRCR